MMGDDLNDQDGSGDINLLLKDLATQLKEVVAQRASDQAFMEGLVQRLDALEQRIGAPSPSAIGFNDQRGTFQPAASGPSSTSSMLTHISASLAAMDTTTMAATNSGSDLRFFFPH
jgi:hypothetical protein